MTVGLWFDFAGTGWGNTAYDDCTPLLRSITYQRGGTAELTGAAQAGSCTIRLLNPDGLFDPDDAAGPLYGLLRDGVRVWFGANEDGTISGAGTVRGRFAGRVLDWTPVPAAGAGTSTPEVEVTCEDALGWYARTPVALAVDCSPPMPPAPCTAVDHFGSPITNTPSGHYPPLLSNTSAANGLVQYASTGGGDPGSAVPWPGHAGSWSFAAYNVGGVDYAGDCVINRARCFVLGAGTITVHTATYGVARHLNADLGTGSTVIIASQAHVPTGTDIVFTVPSDGNCVHWVDVTDDGASCGDKWGFAGFDWVAA